MGNTLCGSLHQCGLCAGAEEAGPETRFSALEKRDTLRTCASQREHAIEVHKVASVGIGTGPVMVCMFQATIN